MTSRFFCLPCIKESKPKKRLKPGEFFLVDSITPDDNFSSYTDANLFREQQKSQGFLTLLSSWLSYCTDTIKLCFLKIAITLHLITISERPKNLIIRQLSASVELPNGETTADDPESYPKGSKYRLMLEEAILTQLPHSGYASSIREQYFTDSQIPDSLTIRL